MVNKAYLAEAFKQLELLNEEDYNLSTDPSAIEDAMDFANADSIMSMNIIDDEAVSEEELQDSYEGKVILDCSICHSKLYKNKEDIIIDEEQDLANVGEECPFCYNNDGFYIIGQVAPFDSDVEEEPEVKETEEQETVKVEDETQNGVDESLNQSTSNFLESHDNCSSYDFQETQDGVLIRDESGNIVVKVPTIEEAEEWAQEHKNESFNESVDITMTPDEAMEYWEQNHENDPVLSKYETYQHWYKDSVENGYIRESIENATVTTTEDTMTVIPKEDGGVVIETMPNNCAECDGETIAPLEPEVEREIEMNELETDEDGNVDIPIDDFDEETFDELGESYLKNTYGNVVSYKTESIKEKEDKFIIEGLITFDSGNTKKTSFIFEGKDVTRSGRIRLIGENCQISRGKKSFTIAGKVNEGKFISESLNYNYRAKDVNGKSARMYGTVRTNK